MKRNFYFDKKDFTGEEGPYQAYSITAEQGLVSVTVNDVTTEFAKAEEYITRLKTENVSPEDLSDTLSDYINRDAALLI